MSGTQNFILVATQQLSAEYDLQTESYNIMVPYNTTDVILGKCVFALMSAYWY